jgi:integral membrane protein (TIGR01906 family)
MKKTGQFWVRIMAVVGSVALILGLLISSIEMFAVNEGFFQREYAKPELNTATSIGISQDELTKVTHKLLAYTTGADDNLDIQAEIQGQVQEVFGEREKSHMVDVKALYLGARAVRTMSLVLAVVLFAAAFIVGKKSAARELCRSFLWASAGFVVVVGAISIYAAMDFNSFWTSFHHVFFTNDLWLLDPRTDVLIQMVPEQFFSDLVMRIIVRFVSIFLALNLAAAVGLKLIRRHSQKSAEG